MMVKYTKKPDGLTYEEDQLIEYRIKVIELETRIKYLEAVEGAARRYIHRVDDGRKSNRHKGFKSAKTELVEALDLYEELEVSRWEENFK